MILRKVKHLVSSDFIEIDDKEYQVISLEVVADRFGEATGQRTLTLLTPIGTQRQIVLHKSDLVSLSTP